MKGVGNPPICMVMVCHILMVCMCYFHNYTFFTKIINYFINIFFPLLFYKNVYYVKLFDLKYSYKSGNKASLPGLGLILNEAILKSELTSEITKYIYYAIE